MEQHSPMRSQGLTEQNTCGIRDTVQSRNRLPSKLLTQRRGQAQLSGAEQTSQSQDRPRLDYSFIFIISDKVNMCKNVATKPTTNGNSEETSQRFIKFYELDLNRSNHGNSFAHHPVDSGDPLDKQV